MKTQQEIETQIQLLESEKLTILKRIRVLIVRTKDEATLHNIRLLTEHISILTAKIKTLQWVSGIEIPTNNP